MRDFLKGLGLDQESIDSIMAEHGKLLTASTEKITELTTKVNNLNTEIIEFKKVDVNDLQKQIEDLTQEKAALEQERDGLKENYSKELNDIKFSSALELEIAKSKAIDPIALKAHLDVSKLAYNEETKDIEGLNEQLAGIKESHAYLFNVGATGDKHGDISDSSSNVTLTDALTERLK